MYLLYYTTDVRVCVSLYHIISVYNARSLNYIHTQLLSQLQSLKPSLLNHNYAQRALHVSTSTIMSDLCHKSEAYPGGIVTVSNDNTGEGVGSDIDMTEVL